MSIEYVEINADIVIQQTLIYRYTHCACIGFKNVNGDSERKNKEIINTCRRKANPLGKQ